MKNTTSPNITSRPHVKWGSLAGAIAIFLIVYVLLKLNLSNTLGNSGTINLFIAYAPLLAIFLSIAAVILLIESFVPSFARYKTFKRKEAYLAACREALRESEAISRKARIARTNKEFEEFISKYPQYKCKG